MHRRPEFFNSTIADNIACGKRECTVKELAHAAKIAGAHEFIIMLPEVRCFLETDYSKKLKHLQTIRKFSS